MRDLLAGVLKDAGLRDGRRMKSLRAAWVQAAGEGLAGRTSVLGYKRQVLEVGVTDAAVRFELESFFKTAILEELRRLLPPQCFVRDLRFRTWISEEFTPGPDAALP